MEMESEGGGVEEEPPQAARERQRASRRARAKAGEPEKMELEKAGPGVTRRMGTTSGEAEIARFAAARFPQHGHELLVKHGTGNRDGGNGIRQEGKK